jgi:hypothetical protein
MSVWMLLWCDGTGPNNIWKMCWQLSKRHNENKSKTISSTECTMRSMKGAFLFSCKESDNKVGNTIFKNYGRMLINYSLHTTQKLLCLPSPHCQQSKIFLHVAKKNCLMTAQTLICPHIQQKWICILTQVTRLSLSLTSVVLKIHNSMPNLILVFSPPCS